MLYREDVITGTPATPLSKLRAVRETLGVTQTELAGRMGLTQARVSAIERTDPARLTVETLADYAQALGGQITISISRSGDSDPTRIL